MPENLYESAHSQKKSHINVPTNIAAPNPVIALLTAQPFFPRHNLANGRSSNTKKDTHMNMTGESP